MSGSNVVYAFVDAVRGNDATGIASTIEAVAKKAPFVSFEAAKAAGANYVMPVRAPEPAK